MNVPFVTGNGMRASIYNAMPTEGVVALVDFMKKFEAENTKISRFPEVMIMKISCLNPIAAVGMQLILQMLMKG